MAAALFAAGCAEPSAAGAPIDVGVSVLRISLPVFVAEREGLFRREGLDVRLRRYETAQPMVEDVLDARLDAGGYAALPIILTACSRDGSEARFATALVEDASHPISELLRRRGDARVRSVSDLRGRTVGILPTIAYRRWLEAVLRHAGVDPGEVTITAIAPPQQAAALSGGGVDALFTNDPMATAVIASGAGERVVEAPVPSALGGELVFGTFLLHPSFVRERPDDARRLVRALDAAVRFVERHPDRARAALREHVRPSERAYADRYPDARFLTSGDAPDALFAREAERERGLGILEAPVDLAGWALGGSP